MAQNYKKAFKCSKCPQSNTEEGCPCWNEVIMTNSQTGAEKIVKGCNFQVLPFLITESIKASNISTNTVAEIKTEIGRGYSIIATAMPEVVQRFSESVEADKLEPGN